MNAPDSKPRSFSRAEWALCFAILLLGSAIVIWFSIPMYRTENLSDDALVTLTYAKNLAAGNGFVYNHPPATLGTTSPLMALVTAGLAFLFPSLTLPRAAVILSAGAWIGAGWLLFGLMRHTGLPPALAAIAGSVPLIAVQGWRLSVGMETWLFEFLLVLAVLLHVREQPIGTGLCIAGLCLVRGEGAVIGAILIGHDLVRQSDGMIKKVVGAAVPVGCWIVYALLVFGTAIPNTLYAKTWQATSSTAFITAMIGDIIPEYLGWFVVWDVWWLNPYLIFVGLGLIWAARRARILLALVLWGALYLGAYAILNPSPYWWYRQHVVFVMQALAGVGIAGAWIIARSRATKLRRVAATLCGLVLVAGLLYPAWSVTAGRFSSYLGDRRGPAYRAVAEWLNDNTSPEERVAFMEVGYLGFYTSNNIVDLVGLTDPEIARNLANGGYAWGFWHYAPEYYVQDELFDWAVGSIDLAEQGYVAVHQVPRDYASVPIYIHKRADRTF
jgi:hypothetical protein